MSFAKFFANCFLTIEMKSLSVIRGRLGDSLLKLTKIANFSGPRLLEKSLEIKSLAQRT